MTRKFILLTLILLVILSGSFFVSKNHQNVLANILFQEQEDTIGAIEKTKKAIVSITTNKDLTRIIEDKNTGEINISSNFVQTSGGSGIIVRKDGLIVTNKHVVSNIAEKYSVVLNNGDVYDATIIALDPIEDIALIKIEAENLTIANFADSKRLRVGQTVLSIGYALGKYQNSVGKGIISGLNRSLVAAAPGGESILLSNMIQTDAAINSGNSGGALIDLNGEVVGINSAIDSGQSVGFAITSNTIRKSISSYEKYGKIKRPQLGIRYLMLDPATAKFTGLTRKDGAWVHSGTNDPSVVPDSPAALAGLQENDIVFEINAIKVSHSLPLSEIISFYEPGQTIGLKVQRGDKVIILKAILGVFE